MGKFKVGDRVLVVARKADIPHQFDIGSEQTVRGVYADGSGVDLGEWACNFDEIEPVAQFKVGDRVIDVSFSDTPATVVEVRHDGVRVQYDGDTEEPVGHLPVWSFSDFIHAPITIETGKYYRTRDGRRVGPAFDCGGYFDVDGWDYSASGKCGWCGQDNEEDYRRQHDLIAEWVDEPAWNTTGFTIPVEDGWYATELGRAYADGYAAGLKAGSEEDRDDVEFDLAVFDSVTRLKRRGLLTA